MLHDLSLNLYGNAFRRSRTYGNFLEEFNLAWQLIRRRLWPEEQHFMGMKLVCEPRARSGEKESGEQGLS
jgi:hypothetical protein